MELLRVVPIALAVIRSIIGPRLTEKQRRMTFLGLRPLADPIEFEHADVLSQVVLYFTVQFVYAVIAPVTSFVLAFCFVYMGAAYRHQFVYVSQPRPERAALSASNRDTEHIHLYCLTQCLQIYPTTPDSGGKLWTRFIRYTLICMLIGEITST